MSPYEKKVRHRLIDLGKSQTWLIEQVKAATGMYCDSSLLHKMYAGKLTAVAIHATSEGPWIRSWGSRRSDDKNGASQQG